MTEPRIEGSLRDTNQRAPAHAAPSTGVSAGLFWFGLAVFIGVALAYPFYSYQVQRRLAARDVSAALVPAVVPVPAEPDAPLTAAEERQAKIAAYRAAEAQPEVQQSTIAVLGTTMVGGKRVVIAELGGFSLAEARPLICQQAAALYRESLAGESLRVQRHRGSEPAVDAGKVVCD
jgi:hypothetical protein